MFKYALLLNNLAVSPTSQLVVNEILSSKRDVTIFLLNKESMAPNPLAVFNISDFLNWRGITITTSKETLEKAKAYPIFEPIISLDNINNETFKFELIEKAVNEYYARHQEN